MKRILLIILTLTLCLPVLSSCVKEPDLYDISTLIIPTDGDAAPGLHQTTFDFDSYQEMINAFRKYDLSKSSYTIRDLKAFMGEPYARFVDKVKADSSFPQPMLDGNPLPYQNKEGFSNITFFVEELYDLPWVWYHCEVDGKRVIVSITYPECVNDEIDYTQNASVILGSIAPNAVNLDNWEERPSYKNVYLKDISIASGEVSALIYELNDSEKRDFTFFIDGALVRLNDYNGVVTEEFLEKFSIEND